MYMDQTTSTTHGHNFFCRGGDYFSPCVHRSKKGFRGGEVFGCLSLGEGEEKGLKNINGNNCLLLNAY